MVDCRFQGEAESQLYVTHRTPEASLLRALGVLFVRMFSLLGPILSAKTKRQQFRLLRPEVQQILWRFGKQFCENIAEHVASIVVSSMKFGAIYP
jgi:hypothetical protein